MLSKVHSVHLTIPNHQGTSSCPPATLDLQCRRMETRFRMVISWFISKPNTTLFVSDKSRNMCICLHQLESSHFGYPAVNHDSNGNSQQIYIYIDLPVQYSKHLLHVTFMIMTWEDTVCSDSWKPTVIPAWGCRRLSHHYVRYNPSVLCGATVRSLTQLWKILKQKNTHSISTPSNWRIMPQCWPLASLQAPSKPL